MTYGGLLKGNVHEKPASGSLPTAVQELRNEWAEISDVHGRIWMIV